MAKRLEIYVCETCGNIVEVLTGGAGELICCGDPMQLQEEKTADWTTEKHVPVVEKTDDGIVGKVGSVPHPMEDDHYIEWIQLVAGDSVLRTFLKPSQAPEALFKLPKGELTAREFCNKHGLWKN